MAKAFFKNAKVESKESGGSSATDAEANYNVFGVSVPFGKVTVFANYAMGEYETVTGTTKLDDQGSQLGVTYAFSKRTSLYGIYGTTKTDLTSSTNEKDKQYAFGMIHSF
jgi:predicted porin